MILGCVPVRGCVLGCALLCFASCQVVNAYLKEVVLSAQRRGSKACKVFNTHCFANFKVSGAGCLRVFSSRLVSWTFV